MMGESLVDDIIRRLLEVRNHPGGMQVELFESEVGQICTASKKILLNQPCLLELEAPVKIAGDIHGQYSDLLRVFEYGGLPPAANYLFLGNYVDFGKQSLETICLLLAYKIKFPENFFLLRGNHECSPSSHIYGFYDECKGRFNVRMWKLFKECFNCLPIAALIDDKIFCVHGGLSPDLHNLDQIRKIPRPIDVPVAGLLCDLLWSDPSKDVQGWAMNDRGVSYTFGDDKVAEFIEKHDLDLICRGHQVVSGGYEFFANRQLVTVFSAPNYIGENENDGGYDNAGAVLIVDENLKCSFQILKPVEKKSRFLFGSRDSIAPSGSSSGVVNLVDNTTTKFEDATCNPPMVKSFEGMNISESGRSNPTSKPESSQGVNPSKISTITAKNRSNSPKIKGGGLERLYGEERERRNELEEDLFKKNEELRVMSLEKSSLQEEIERLRHQVAEMSENVSDFFADFSVMEIKEATNNFNESMVIGEGGYGKVYRGLLRHTKVAIKVPKPGSSQGSQEFNQEVKVLSRVRHPSIVSLIGVCSEASALIYEYIPKGSLEDRLSCKDGSPPLSWKERIRIARELCCVLIFLQSSKPESIVHGDLKPANILLDANLSCKISDFGICRGLVSMAKNGTLIYMTTPKGTFAYIDPIFLTTGELTPKSDVYSYGIILLQLLTGKPGMNIRNAVQDAFKKGALHEMLDASAGEWPLKLASRLAKVALGCCEMNRRDRPHIWAVLNSLGLSKTV